VGILVIVAESIPDEADLIRRSRQGDAAAFRALVAAHAEPLWRCARALCRDDHEAEDLAQEALVEAWRSLVRFDESRRFSTWLYGILRHRFLKARRRRRPVASGKGEAADRPGREASPIAAAEQAAEARLVQAAVAALPDQHRVVAVSPTMNDQPSSCDALHEPISLLAAGCLPLEEQAAVRSHLAGCRACAAQFTELTAMCGSLERSRPAPAPAAAILGR